MQVFIFFLLVGLVSLQSVTKSERDALIDEIFRKPPPTPIPLENLIVKPTEGSTTKVNKDGQSCECLPFYLCDENNGGVDANNVSFTGWGSLDVRFGEDDDIPCLESVEVCCVIPKDSSVPKPQPDSTKVKECGYANPNGLGASFIGTHTQFGEFPWVVALLDSNNFSYVGVGVLINPQVVMTAAHVVFKYASGKLRIRAGEWDTQTEKEIYEYQEREVQDVLIHSEFRWKTLWNDIALLRLEQPFQLSEHINIICLPEQDEVFDSHTNCVANGWGKDLYGIKGRYAVILKKVEVDMVPYTRCSNLLKRTRLGSSYKLHSSFLCAGGEEDKDTCQGDGGAPLACPIGGDRYKLTGLVAWGIGCGQKDVPAVYTNVPKFRGWVDNKMAEWGLQGTYNI